MGDSGSSTGVGERSLDDAIPESVFAKLDEALESGADDGELAAILASIPAPWRDQAAAILDARRSVIASAVDSAREPRARPAPGSSFGPYEIIEAVGEGAQGTVYRARDTRLQRDVALKVIDVSGRTAEAQLARFRREAEVASRIDHPGVCTVFDAGEVDGRPFIAMRYVAGETLSDLVRRERPARPPDRAQVAKRLRLIERCARAVHAAHACGVVHRDLKPGNIVVTPSGDPVILDFGLARDGDTTADLTIPGAAVGTPTYMSPEQVSPGASAIDARTDVWSLGVILFELLTNRVPFEAPTRDGLYHAILHRSPPDPCALNVALTRDARVVLLAALEKDPTRRYASALDFADDVRQLIEGRAPVARPVSPLGAAGRWVRRNPLVTASLALVIVTTTIAAVVGLRLAADARVERDRARDFARVADGNRLIAQAQVIAPQSPGLAALLALAGDERAGGGNVAANALLRILDRPIEEQALIGHRGAVLDARISHDATFCVTASKDGTVGIWDRVSGVRRLSIVCEESSPTCLGLSPDDRVLAIGLENGALHLVDPVDGRELRSATRHSAPVTSVAFDRRGSRLASSSRDRTILVWNVADLAPMLLITDRTSSILSVAWNPTDQTLGAGSEDGRVVLWRADDGSSEATLGRQSRWAVQEVAFTHDGRSIVGASDDNRAWSWDLETQTAESLQGHLSGVTSVDTDPTGLRAVTACFDRSAIVWDLRDRAALTVLAGHTSTVHRARYSSDGKRVITASADGTARIWPMTDSAGVFTRQSPPSMASRARPSPDGSKLALAQSDEIAVFDSQNGDELARLACNGSLPVSVGFDENGTRIVAAMADGSARLWRLDAPQSPLELGAPSPTLHAPGSAMFSSDGRLVAVAVGEGPLRIHDATTGASVCAVAGCGPFFTTGNVARCAFDRSSTRVITVVPDGGRRTAVVWDARTGHRLRTLATHASEVLCVAVDPSSERVAVSDSDGIVLVQALAGDGVPLQIDAHADGTTSVTFDRLGRRLLTCGRDDRAKLFDAESGACIRTFTGHRSMLYEARFSPDETKIATASWDTTASVFDVASGARLLVQQGHGSPVFSAAFTNFGRSVATHALDGSTRVWPVDTVGVARQRIHRRFTADERCENGLECVPDPSPEPHVTLPRSPRRASSPPER